MAKAPIRSKRSEELSEVPAGRAARRAFPTGLTNRDFSLIPRVSFSLSLSFSFPSPSLTTDLALISGVIVDVTATHHPLGDRASPSVRRNHTLPPAETDSRQILAELNLFQVATKSTAISLEIDRFIFQASTRLVLFSILEDRKRIEENRRRLRVYTQL